MLRQGIIFVLSAPSGGGKTTIYKAILQRMNGITYSVSCTTRQPRSDEVDGRDYFFLERDRFEKMVVAGEFLEWAEVHGSLYGTRKQMVLDTVATGSDIMLDIDVQGARQLRKVFPEAVFLFLFPPSLAVLEQRLRGRKSDRDDSIQRRLEIARLEMAEYRMYDYLIINDEVENAIDEVMAVIRAERNAINRLNDHELKRHYFANNTRQTSVRSSLPSSRDRY